MKSRQKELDGMLEYDVGRNVMGKYQPGDFVKVEIRDEGAGQSEWMWVKVESSDDVSRIVFGRLDNEPIVSMHVRLGMDLAVSYDNVRGHRTARSFDQ